MFRIFVGAGLCVLFTLPLSSCVDAESHPLALAVASETRGAVLLRDDLPTVPKLISSGSGGHDGVAISEAWWDSWHLEAARCAHARQALYPLAAHLLAPDLPPSEIEELLSRVDANIAAVKSVAVLLDPGTIGPALIRAAQLHEEAADALGWGDAPLALELILEASDLLWSLSPQRVAIGLVQEASEAFGRNAGSASYSEEESIRIRRLVYGANQALEEGDYPGAIRRAYYACQLLGVGTL